MQINQIESDLYLFIGDTYNANTTIFIADNEVLLVDALGSVKDAEALRKFVEQELNKEVRVILSTHYFSDHLGALKTFPHATIFAHENYLETFTSETNRTDEEVAFFVEPHVLISDRLQIRWGRFTLNVSHNPGHTNSTLAVDVPEADLLLVGDTVVGNILYLRYSTPQRLATALENLRRKSRSRLISSHGNLRSTSAIENAAFYLDRLRRRVEQDGLPDSFLSAPLEDFLVPGIEATSYERMFHQRNLDTILERRLFLDESHHN